ncbi:MAG: hypothetical protein EOP67_32115 [Sphingomonas sp.]|nr:MAG: hypothetical protein EOP67_32115 [Sphingomonas sp.]
MASKRTEKIILGVVGALAAAVFVSKALEPNPAPTPPPAIDTTTPEPMPTTLRPEPQAFTLKSRQMTDADRVYYEGALASQAKAFGESGDQVDMTRRAREVEGMTQAARDAGYDADTARRLGSEAAALCNGDPKCLE